MPPNIERGPSPSMGSHSLVCIIVSSDLFEREILQYMWGETVRPSLHEARPLGQTSWGGGGPKGKMYKRRQLVLWASVCPTSFPPPPPPPPKERSDNGDSERRFPPPHSLDDLPSPVTWGRRGATRYLFFLSLSPPLFVHKGKEQGFFVRAGKIIVLPQNG